MDPQLAKMYEKWGVTPPSTTPHGTDDDIRSNLRKAVPTNWRQEGNKLICDTELGPLVNMIPTDMLLVGVDKKNLPILRKITL